MRAVDEIESRSLGVWISRISVKWTRLANYVANAAKEIVESEVIFI